MNAWLRGPLKDTFHDAVMTRKEILGMPLNQKKIGAMIQEHMEKRVDQTRSLWTLLSLALWEKKHYRARHEANNSAALKSSILARRTLSEHRGLVA
jgi:hypothetical protein